jgi:four helix bundle protein
VPKLRDQCLRAAASISANIVEGCGLATRKEFSRYLAIAINSSKETEHHLLRLFRARVIDAAMYYDFEARVIEVRKMLYGLRKRVLEKDDE